MVISQVMIQYLIKRALMSLFLAMIVSSNLIQDGDFQNFVLTHSQGSRFTGQYRLRDYFNCFTWFRRPDNTTNFQVCHYLNTTNQGLDTINGYADTDTCQNVTVEINKTYLVQFDYLIDYPVAKKINVTFDDVVIFSAEVSLIQIIQFSAVVRAFDTVGTLCFFGIYTPGVGQARRGVIIDNVNMTEATATQVINFDVIENWGVKKLILSSDYIVDPAKIDSFNGTVVTIGGVESPLLETAVGARNNLQLVTDLDISLNYSALDICIYIADYMYTDANGYGVRFMLLNTSHQVLELQVIIPDNITNISTDQDEQEPTIQSQIIDIVALLLNSLRLSGLIGFAALIFRFTSFANIYIMYIFLNIRYLDPDVREGLERFAQILLGKGVISTFSQLLLYKEVDLTQFKVTTVQKLPENFETYGSSFHVINISTNLFDTCFEQLLVMIGNCITIVIIWQLVIRIKKCQQMQKNISGLQARSFKNSIFIQIISVAPVWTLSVALTLRYQLASYDLITKLNQAIFITIPGILFMIWFLIYLNYYAMKKISLKKEQVQKKQKQKPRESKFHKHKNPQKRKQMKRDKERPKVKYVYLSNALERMEALNCLFFVVFGFIIGLQSMYLFFTLITLYKIVFIILLWKNHQFSFDYLFSVVETLIKLSIHLSFLILFVLTQLVRYNKIKGTAVFIKEWGNLLSQIILYALLSGFVFQALLFIGNTLRFIIYFLRTFRENKANPLIEQNINEKKNNLTKILELDKELNRKIFPKNSSLKTKKDHELMMVQQINGNDKKYIFDVIQQSQGNF